MKTTLILILFCGWLLAGCTVGFDSSGATARASIYADASVDRAVQRRLAEEARAAADVDKEYYRQEGKTERAQLWVIVLGGAGGATLVGMWLYWRGRERVELARHGIVIDARQPIYRYPQIPAQPGVMLVRNNRELMDYTRQQGGYLQRERNGGYVVMLPDGTTQRLLTMRDGA